MLTQTLQQQAINHIYGVEDKPNSNIAIITNQLLSVQLSLSLTHTHTFIQYDHSYTHRQWRGMDRLTCLGFQASLLNYSLSDFCRRSIEDRARTAVRVRPQRYVVGVRLIVTKRSGENYSEKKTTPATDLQPVHVHSATIISIHLVN